MTYSEEVKAAALEYASLGWAVFPVYPNKRPFTEHGLNDATTDPKIIEKWYEDNKNLRLGVAIATGEKSGGLVVIDVDEHEAYTDPAEKKHGAAHGAAALQEWEGRNGALPLTIRAKSGHGGTHYYFHSNTAYRSTTKKVAQDIDTRADGGYIIAPPTNNPGWGAYTWELSPVVAELAEVSGNVRELLKKAEAQQNPTSEQTANDTNIIAGGRTDYLIAFAGKLWNTGASTDAIKAAIEAENENKCAPPLSREELEREVFPALSRNWDRPQKPKLPPFSKPRILPGELPPLKPELIAGILRQGHKFQLSAPSKAGKSFLLIELAVALASGGYWLGLKCKQGKVLYLNLEIDAASFDNRLERVCKATQARPEQVAENILIWHLRGFTRPLEELLEPLREQIRITGAELEAVIIDPVYKLGLGDENSAEAVGKFCNEIDQLAETTQAAVIYAHHHSKGAQGRKSSIDRASGSGVFARDPDAIMSMSPLVCTGKDDTEKSEKELEAEEQITAIGRKAFRCTFTLREFADHEAINCYFDHPVHSLENNVILATLPEEGSTEANLLKSKKRKSKKSLFPEAFDYLLANPDGDTKTPEGTVKIQNIADYLGVTGRTVKNWLYRDYSAEYDRVETAYCSRKLENKGGKTGK